MAMGSINSNPPAEHEELKEMSPDYISAQELVPANSGAIMCQVKSRTGAAQLHLLTMHHRVVYTINLRKRSSVNTYNHENQHIVTDVENYTTEFIKLKKKYQGFWVTWINSEVCVGHTNSGVPFMEYYPKRSESELIRYIIFDKGDNGTTKWRYEMPPNVFETRSLVKINGGELRWVPIDKNSFPADALIGGFENEPLYIIQALHDGSKCPGKHVPSKNFGFIPMDVSHATHHHYMILCGYDAAWVETSGKNIPKNAFVAGSSNYGAEPLYIGRSVHDGHLINGKVADSQCIIPYRDDVFAYDKYEILVLPNGLGDVGSNPA